LYKIILLKMITRSQSRYEKKSLYKVDINFDEASDSWKSNKKSIGNGMYQYICCKLTKSGKICNKKCLLGIDYCKIHNKIK